MTEVYSLSEAVDKFDRVSAEMYDIALELIGIKHDYGEFFTNTDALDTAAKAVREADIALRAATWHIRQHCLR